MMFFCEFVEENNMPIYAFKCEKCDHKIDLLKSIHESELPAPCPICDGLMRATFDMSNVSFELKGDWFKTRGKY